MGARPAYLQLRYGMDKAAGTEKVSLRHHVGARLAPLGKWSLESAFLSVVPGAKNFSTDGLSRCSEDWRDVRRHFGGLRASLRSPPKWCFGSNSF